LLIGGREGNWLIGIRGSEYTGLLSRLSIKGFIFIFENKLGKYNSNSEIYVKYI